jgi:hypothetical protein
MKILLVWIAAFAIAGIIISPFFWLRFLKEKGVGKYLMVSSVGTIFFLYIYIYVSDSFLLNLTAKYNTNMYYFFDSLDIYPALIVIFLIIISPLIFIKIIKHNFNIWNFLLGLFSSVTIFIAIFLYWAYVLLPQAFSHLHDYF